MTRKFGLRTSAPLQTKGRDVPGLVNIRAKEMNV
jgi:hypothetical protein